MMDPALFTAFVAAVVVLMLIPGPNVSLIVANSVAHGARYGLFTVAGTSSAQVLQLGLTALGMAQLLTGLGHWFEWLRWVGAAYLVYLGIMQWRAIPVDLARTKAEPKSPRAIGTRAFLVSLTNPKALVFYGAFFPQFITPNDHVGAQVAFLSATFLIIAISIDCLWALAATRMRHLLASRGRLRNRISGGFLIGAGAGLALAHRSNS
jgi:homoserine/homoserine lactone efflux protein